MYSVSDAKKFLNQTNILLVDSNNLVIDKFVTLVLEKFDNIDKDNLEQLAFSLKDEINNDHLSNVFSKKKKRTGPKRAPTLYNLFIKEHMGSLKKENPDMKNNLLMKKAAELWGEEKKKKELERTMENPPL
jgi:hypothetical protein|tara:strand:- start:5127 stop:5519 length:393 start_codon:yes stop_codon:yes gene_type:complete